MRQYEPIWAAIKKNNHASIRAPIENHSRVIKAVTKEKYNDEGYKLMLEEKGLKAKMLITKHKDDSTLVTFSLQITLKTSCIGVHML